MTGQMEHPMPSYFLRFFVCLCLVLIASSCGKGGDKGQCVDVTCDGGVCDPGSGVCINPSVCGDDATCIGGFECVEGSCIAQFACGADGSCERGDCVNGACVNPDRCDASTDCVPGYACDRDVCIVDRCDLVTCDRGVCEKETGDCVNAAVCTAATQETDCVAGSTCYDQRCQDEATICADLACERGVCSYLELACVNGEDCAGDDLNCLSGSFCNAVNQCQQNVCDEDGVNCARGVCEASSGACVNADPCTAAGECVDGFYCIDGGCEEITTACDTCVGSQTCDYDEGSLAVVCSEDPDGCVTSIDCVGSRECVAGQCGEPVPCVADAFEPNDSLATAVNWFDVNDAPVRGSVCAGDADYFSFDVRQDPDFTGTLLALLTIPQSDIGVGTLALEFQDEDGATVASTTSRPTDQFVRIEYAIGNINQGTYTLVIRAGSVGDGGIEYDLFMDLAPNTTVAMCQSAPVLGATQNGDTSASTSNGLGSSCIVDAAATEEAWILEVTERSFVTIDVQSAEFDAVISLRAQCESDASEISCEDSTSGAGAESLGARLSPGSYYVLVQGATSTQSGAYTLTVSANPILCTSSDNTCVDAATASVCNGQGTGFDMVTCDNGCDAAIGACLREQGDVCTTAIDATNGYVGTIALGLLQNDYEAGASCVSSGSFSVTDGPDAVFSLTLQPDEVVVATADQSDFDDISLYLISDCQNVTASCLEGVNNGGSFTAETLIYTNDTAAAQDLFLVLDSESGTLGGVAVDIVVAPVICTPGMAQCAGDTLETCNSLGTGDDTRSCSFGCDAGTTACIPPPNETCGAGAIDVSAGGSFTGVFSDYADDYSDPRGCTPSTARGPDAVYQITGTPGDIVDVSLSGSFDGVLYAVTDCSELVDTCLAGSDSGQPEEIRFVIPDSNPVYIIADSWSSTTTAAFTLDVSVRQPECVLYNEAITCQPDGTTLQFCNEVGLFEDYACATTCTAGACDEPTGDRCFDVPTITSGASISGNYTNLTNAVNPGTGTCISGSTGQPGRDAIYEIELFAGDLLTAELTTSVFGASMYVITDCNDARNSCEWAAPQSKELQFYVETSGTYLLVVDTTSTFSTGPFTLDVDVQNGFVCQPGSARCDQQTDILTACNFDGTMIENTVTCANGCANNQACAGPTNVNDVCMDAEVISGSVRYLDTWARFTNVLDPGLTTGNSCGISSFQSDGPEAIYVVTLGPNEVIDVSVDDLGAFDSPAVYIVGDCTDPETTCHSFHTASPVARTAYISEFGETVYVIVDNTGASVDDPFLVDFDIRPSQCAPTLNACQDLDTREFCDQYGILQTEDCFFGCTGGACNPPTNDTCATPTDLSGGGVVTIPYAGYNNDYGTSTIPCTGFSANGPDAVFEVTASANDIITARLSGPSSDTSLWITTTCGDATACVAGDDSGGQGAIDEVIYPVPMDGTYYIMADSFTSSPSGSFTLEVIVSPPICVPGAASCDMAGQNVEVCNGIGSAVEVFECDVAGCVVADTLCATQTGEHPAAAIDANALGQFTGSFTDFVDDFNLASGTSCTGWRSPGPDAAYFVDLTTGQTLTATLNGTDDTSLYIMDALSDPDSTCLVGDDAFGSGETVDYTATADGRVYVIVDAFDASPTGTFTLDLAVQ